MSRDIGCLVFSVVQMIPPPIKDSFMYNHKTSELSNTGKLHWKLQAKLDNHALFWSISFKKESDKHIPFAHHTDNKPSKSSTLSQLGGPPLVMKLNSLFTFLTLQLNSIYWFQFKKRSMIVNTKSILAPVQ